MSSDLAETSIRTYKSRTPRHHDIASPDLCRLSDKRQFLTYPRRDLRLRVRQTNGSAMYGGLKLDNSCY